MYWSSKEKTKMSGKQKKYKAVKRIGSQWSSVQDMIVAEGPLQININGKPYTVTMRTPGSDIRLVRGLLYTENIYRGNSQIDIHPDKSGNIASTWIEPAELLPGYYQSRSLLSVSSCGICGKRELGDLEIEEAPLLKAVVFNEKQISDFFTRMHKEQKAFLITGGTHAAAAFDGTGRLLSIEEDIGRHNAVDKVIGCLLENSLLDEASFLLVSGRISYEIVNKCFKAGIPVLAAVSSPSSMAIESAEKMGITLLAFCRGENFTCYAHAGRIANQTFQNKQS